MYMYMYTSTQKCTQCHILIHLCTSCLITTVVLTTHTRLCISCAYMYMYIVCRFLFVSATCHQTMALLNENNMYYWVLSAIRQGLILPPKANWWTTPSGQTPREQGVTKPMMHVCITFTLKLCLSGILENSE